MRIANVAGRAALVVEGRVVDLERASGGRLPSDPMAILSMLDDVRDISIPADAPLLETVKLEAPVPRPQKIIAAGLNYRSHIEEARAEAPQEPVLFGRFPSALAGPSDDVVLPPECPEIDWEVELVVVIGRRGKAIPVGEAWSYVAGYTCGQDISDRVGQRSGAHQYTIPKSFDTFAPIGPVLMTKDEVPDVEHLTVICRIDGELVQQARLDELVFSIPELISASSRYCTLEPGDLLFTGTPAGVGLFRQPQRFLRPGNVVETEIEGIGMMRNVCVAEL